MPSREWDGAAISRNRPVLSVLFTLSVKVAEMSSKQQDGPSRTQLRCV